VPTFFTTHRRYSTTTFASVLLFHPFWPTAQTSSVSLFTSRSTFCFLFFYESNSFTCGATLPLLYSRKLCSPFLVDMDNWRVAVLGDGGVGKTALAVQVRTSCLLPVLLLMIYCSSLLIVLSVSILPHINISTSILT